MITIKEIIKMANCHTMKKGEIYLCQDCGMELKVVNECKESNKPEDECQCHTSPNQCVISCCGKTLVKKGA